MVSSSTRTLNDLGGAAPVAWSPLEPPVASTKPPHLGPLRRHLTRWLQDSLSTELVCVLRGRGAKSSGQGPVAGNGSDDGAVDGAVDALAPAHHNGVLGIAPFMAHPNGLLEVDPPARATRAARPARPERRRQPMPDSAEPSPDELTALKASLRDTLVAERVAVETYRQVIGLIDDRDDSTRHMVEALLADELEHVAQLEAWLAEN